MGEERVVTDEAPPASEKSLAQLFKDACPVYMAMGMSYKEYWYGSADMTRAYRQADDIKRHRINQELWLQGIYMSHALASTVGNMFSKSSSQAIKYPDEPLPLNMDEAEQQEERRQREQFERMKASMIKWAENSQKKPSEAHNS